MFFLINIIADIFKLINTIIHTVNFSLPSPVWMHFLQERVKKRTGKTSGNEKKTFYSKDLLIVFDNYYETIKTQFQMIHRNVAYASLYDIW